MVLNGLGSGAKACVLSDPGVLARAAGWSQQAVPGPALRSSDCSTPGRALGTTAAVTTYSDASPRGSFRTLPLPVESSLSIFIFHGLHRTKSNPGEKQKETEQGLCCDEYKISLQLSFDTICLFTGLSRVGSGAVARNWQSWEGGSLDPGLPGTEDQI